MNNNTGIVVVGGQVYKLEATPIYLRKFDREQSEDGRTVKRIDISSEIADVKISSSDSSTVSAHLYGEAFIDGDINFAVTVQDEILSIVLNPLGDCINAKLSLDISIPCKTYDDILVMTSGEKKIIVDNSISVKDLVLKSKNGALFSNATFSSIFLTTSGGLTELHINPTKDISVDFSTDRGHAFLDFSNIGHLSFSANSANGAIHNNHKEKSGYQADVKISTITGSILIS